MGRTISTIGLALALVSAVFLVVAGGAAAQGLGEPLQAKLDEKVAEAEEDPAGFAQNQATEAQLADDANWTIAYTCFLAHVAGSETGTELPDPDQCADYEEVLGIAEDAAADAEEEAVADVQELEDDAIAEAEVLAEDALATASEILDDPEGALDALTAFVDRALRSVMRIVDALVGGLDSAGVMLGDALMVLGKASAIMVAAPFVGAHKLGLLLWDGGATGASAIGTGLGAAIDGIAAGVTASGAAISDGASATWTTITDATSALTDAVGGLFGDDAAAPTPDQAALPTQETQPVTDRTDRLLDTVTDTLDG